MVHAIRRRAAVRTGPSGRSIHIRAITVSRESVLFAIFADGQTFRSSAAALYLRPLIVPSPDIMVGGMKDAALGFARAAPARGGKK